MIPEQCLFGPGSCTAGPWDWLMAQLYTLPIGWSPGLLGLLSSTFQPCGFYPLSKVTELYHAQNVRFNGFIVLITLPFSHPIQCSCVLLQFSREYIQGGNIWKIFSTTTYFESPLSKNINCQAPSQIPSPLSPAPTQSNPVKISSKGTGADTKILWATHPPPPYNF